MIYGPREQATKNSVRSPCANHAKNSLVLCMGLLFTRARQNSCRETSNRVCRDMCEERREESKEPRMENYGRELTKRKRHCVNTRRRGALAGIPNERSEMVMRNVAVVEERVVLQEGTARSKERRRRIRRREEIEQTGGKVTGL